LGADPLFTFLSFFHHLLSAKGRHGTHSPFVYSLVDEVIIGAKKKSLSPIEEELVQSKKDNQVIRYIDPKTQQHVEQTISSIAKGATSTVKFRCFLKGIGEYLKVNRILETGTSLGYASAYLASAYQKPIVYSIEGNEALAFHAQQKWNHLDNLTIHNGNIYELYPKLIDELKPDMIFLDADHRPQTIDFYLQQLTPLLSGIHVIIIHDIYWSRAMNKKWKEIINKKEFVLSIDLFQAGLLFPNLNMPKQHFKLFL
jgi:predicted O-methyltransferase YrrM